MLFFLVCHFSHVCTSSFHTYRHSWPFSHVCRCHLSFFPRLSLVFPCLSHHARFFTRLSFLYISFSHAYATSLHITLHHYYITPFGRSLIRALCQKGPPQSFLSGSFLAYKIGRAS